MRIMQQVKASLKIITSVTLAASCIVSKHNRQTFQSEVLLGCVIAATLMIKHYLKREYTGLQQNLIAE